MFSSKSATCGIPLKQVGLISLIIVVAFLSSWGSATEAAWWDIVVVAVIMAALAVHIHITPRAPAKRKSKSVEVPQPAVEATGKPIIRRTNANEAEEKRRRQVRLLREKLGVAATGADFSAASSDTTDAFLKAYSWLNEVEAQPPRTADEDDNLIFSTVWRMFARRKDSNRLERLLVCMRNWEVPTNVTMYTQLLSTLGRRGRLGEAKDWFDKMNQAGLKGDAQAYSALIHCCAQLGKTGEAKEWYEQMIAQGVSPTEVTFNSLVNACAKSKKPELGEQWVESMEATGVRPTVCTFNALINAATKAGQTERAEFWLMEIIRRGMEPDIVSYSTIIHAMSFKKIPSRVMQADRLMRLMLNRGVSCPRQMGYNFRCVIMVCARGRELDLAKYWLNDAERRGANAGKYAYKFVACALEIVGRMDEAAAIRSRMNRLPAASESPQGAKHPTK